MNVCAPTQGIMQVWLEDPPFRWCHLNASAAIQHYSQTCGAKHANCGSRGVEAFQKGTNMNHPQCSGLERCPVEHPHPGRHHEVGCPAWRPESVAPYGDDLYIEDALKALLDFCIGSERRERRNPYANEQVRNAIRSYELATGEEYRPKENA